MLTIEGKPVKEEYPRLKDLLDNARREEIKEGYEKVIRYLVDRVSVAEAAYALLLENHKDVCKILEKSIELANKSQGGE